MIKRCIWQKRFDGIYQIIDTVENMENLAHGLEDLGLFFDWTMTFLNDPKRNEYGGNRMYIEKKENTVHLGDIYADKLPDPYEYIIPIKDFILLLEQFPTIEDEQKQYIILSENNGKYALEAKDTLE